VFFSDTSKGWTLLIEGDDKDFPERRKQDLYPFIWTHEFEGARGWFGMMGHIASTYSDTIWRKLVLRGIFYALNRSGWGPTTGCADSFRPVLRNSEEWTLHQGRDPDGIVKVFDFAGRTIGSMPRSSFQQAMPFPSNLKLPFGTYIVAPKSRKRYPAVRWMPPMR
jgi:hypothetical protein